MRLRAGVPILRIFDVDRAKDFYLGYLDMRLDFEHRFEPNTPLFMQVSRDDLVLYLSEHHGDGTPDTVVYIPTEDVRELHADLSPRPYAYLRPGISSDEESHCLSLLDPFGNTLRFEERH